MTKKASEQLLSLAETDAKLVKLRNQEGELVDKRKLFSQEIQHRRARLAECEAAVREGSLKQVMDEHRLRDEHEKIINRRKQLVSLGGAKLAKVLEREIDVANRALGVLEENAIKALEQVDVLEAQLGEFRQSLEKLEVQFEADSVETEKVLEEVANTRAEVEKDREKLVLSIEERLVALYDKVSSRYPGDAVSVASSGSCRSCFRALPPQTYNQVLAGNSLIQCPGCKRILVHPASEVE
ncbi:MAG: hypothetical protein IT291_08880 [Deltaproteobacteria bacterium]|nr:hypothetical protein [Deltaproteobacteria bacterium]